MLMMDHQQGAVTPGGVTEMNKVVGGGAMPTAAMMHSMEYPWLGQMAAFSMPQPTPTSTAAAATLLQVSLQSLIIQSYLNSFIQMQHQHHQQQQPHCRSIDELSNGPDSPDSSGKDGKKGDDR